MDKDNLKQFINSWFSPSQGRAKPSVSKLIDRGLLHTVLKQIIDDLPDNPPVPPTPPTSGPLKLTLREDGAIGITIPSEIPTVEYIEYSIDGENWTKVDRTPGEPQEIFLLEGTAGDSVYVRGQATAYAYESGEDFYPCNIAAFTNNSGEEQVSFDVEGNLLSLLGDTDFATTTCTFDCLFLNTLVVDASKLVLPNTTVDYCYESMFSGCPELTAAPELPATVLAEGCYSEMFSGCMSLITTPELIATTLAVNCYSNMFANCTSLQEVTMLATDISATDCLSAWLIGAGIAAQSRIIINNEASFSQQDLNYNHSKFAVYNQSGELIWDYMIQ